LEELAKPAREHARLSAAARDALLVALCAVRPLSIHELSALVERSVPALREPLRALIARHELRFLYPRQPSHPGQKYVAAEANDN
jgi:hypothetical protein